ncbi:exported hypothetical protein [Candidatus Methanoperedens nitroreducens]|uniref:MarR family transcriptional regulator n=2 Tax=Candidatus Methanoperedens nitratireducens TaxID=1392998 RepID=A0A284VNM5_9EURY|nr:exported hypothetical protein [Candidatus Methanoperedens nitroreducens]
MPSSAVLMTKAVFIIIFLMLWVQVSTAQVSDQNVFTIDIHGNGDALWTVEKRMPLTASELNEWEVMIKKGQNISRYQNQIKSDLDGLLLSAKNSSNRSMKIGDFNISYGTERTLSSVTGIIVYSFEWKNFSRTYSGNILIGDTFSEGSVFSLDSTLIIKIPSGFEVQSVSPKFDKQVENSLIWNGQSFGKGEPFLVLKPAVVDQDTSSFTLSTATLVIPIVILISGTLLVTWKWRRSRGKKDSAVLTDSDENETPRTGNIEADTVRTNDSGTGALRTYGNDNATQTGSPGAGIVQPDKARAEATAQIDNNGIATSQAGDAGINATPADNIKTESVKDDISQPPFPYLPEEFLSDEEMIERYLTKCGGQAYQSDIVKDSGLSKSKISIVLAKMKDDGKVIKIKKGKENIIRLAVKKE